MRIFPAAFSPLHWELGRETEPAGFSAQAGGGEKYEEIRQGFFCILIVLAEVLKYSFWCCNVIGVGAWRKVRKKPPNQATCD